SFRGIVIGCRRITRRRVDEHSAQAGKSLVLAWYSGIRIRGSRPPMADIAFHRSGVLALADVASIAARAAETRSELFASHDVCCFEHRDPAVLCRRFDVRSAQQSGHGGILAMVGGASLG